MGLRSRLTTWLGDLFGGTEAAESTAADRAADADTTGDDEDDEAGDDASTLDPAAATETRTVATDDAVDALRDVRRSQESAAAANDDTGSANDTDADPDPDTSTDRNRS